MNQVVHKFIPIFKKTHKMISRKIRQSSMKNDHFIKIYKGKIMLNHKIRTLLSLKTKKTY